MSNLEEQQILEVENQYWADMWIALERLMSNKDFEKVILQGYFKDKAINGVSLLARDAIKDSGRRTDVMEDLIAISSLEDFFVLIENMGSRPLDEDDEDEVNRVVQ